MGPSSATSTRSPIGSAPTSSRQGAAQGVPEPLLVPVGRGRPLRFVVLLITGTYLTLVLRGFAAAARLRRVVHAAAGHRGVGGLRLGDADLLRRQGRPADPPDAPLGGARVRRRHRPAHGPGLLHRRLPPAPRDQLGRRRAAADPRPRRRVHRLLAARRPAVGQRPADHPGDHPRHPVRRRAGDVPPVRRRVAGHRHHRAPLPGAHPADPGRHRRPARRSTSRSCGARSTPSSAARAGPSATSSGCACGPASRSSRSGCCSSSPA